MHVATQMFSNFEATKGIENDMMKISIASLFYQCET